MAHERSGDPEPRSRGAGPASPSSGRSAPTPLDGVVVLLLAYVPGAQLAAALTGGLEGPVRTAAGLAVFGGVFAVVALAWVALRHRAGVAPVVGGPPRAGPVLLGVAAGLAAGVVLGQLLPAAAEWVADVVDVELPTPQPAIREALADPAARMTAIIGAVVAAPLGEELAFRGVLFRGLRSAAGFVPALLISAVTFALLHTTELNAIGLVYVVVVLTPLAALLAVLVERQRAIWGAVACHATYNAVAVTILLSA